MNKKPSPANPKDVPEQEFVRKVLIVVAIVGFAAILYLLSEVLLLIFTSILFAVVLKALARPIARYTHIGQRLSLLAAILGIVGIVGGTIYLFGAQISTQLAVLIEELPGAVESLSRQLPFLSWDALMRDSSVGNLLTRAVAWGSTVFGAVGAFFVVIVTGIYMAINPRVYRSGFLMLFPTSSRELVKDTIDDAGVSLHHWLAGQLIAMILVGSLIAVGLAIVGVPSSLALGLIAGLTEFIPIVGPIIGAVPALLLASTVSWELVAWTLGVFVIVQQVEGNIIMPIIAKRSVELPPAVGLFALVAFGVLFGPLGLLLGYPLAVVISVVVRRLYVHAALGEPLGTSDQPSQVDRPA